MSWKMLLEKLASGNPLVGANDVRRWNRLEFERAVAFGILREDETATAILCDSCDEGHWSEVRWAPDGRRAFIACPEVGSVNVEPSRLRQWRIDPGRVAALAGNALGLSIPVEVMRPQLLWNLGRRRLGGRYHDIFFCVEDGLPLTEMSAAIRRAVGQSPALLLTVGWEGNLDALPSGHVAVDLMSVSRMDGSQVLVDLVYLEDRFSDSAQPPRRAPSSIPAPAGVTWNDVSVTVFDEFLRITIDGNMREVTFGDIGVEQRSQPIELLKLFAAARGTLDAVKIAGVVSGDTPIKTRILRLRQFLQDLVDIDGDPFRYTRKAQAYTCHFDVGLGGGDGFRTPQGASWLDFSFHEREDGRVLVTVPERCRFRSHSSERETGHRRAEVAERDGMITMIHSLEEIGFRDGGGKLTEDGRAFLHLLRTGGIPRAGNDMVVLRLAQRLRDWTGLDGDPIRLVEASRSWNAAFSCSSEIGRRKFR